MPEFCAEADLLEQARKGKEAAFLALYERHRECVFRFAYRMLGSVPMAEDVTHDCFLSLLSKPGLFDPSRSSVRTYLCAAARNLAYGRLRRMGREATVDELLDDRVGDTDAGPLQQVLTTELAETVNRAVASLPPLQREAVTDRIREALNLVLAADTLAARRNFPRAIAEYEKALAINPNDPGIHNRLGLCLQWSGRLDEGKNGTNRRLS